MNKSCTVISLLLVSGFTSFCYAQPEPVVLEFTPISVEQYQDLAKQKPTYSQPQVVEIGDEAAAYAMLGEQIKIVSEQIDDSEWYKSTLYLYNPDGEQIYQYKYFDECAFSAFYPQEQLIYFVCGHESDWLVSTKTGEEIDENPRYRMTSPDGRHRISGYYNGQEPWAFLQSYDEGKWCTPEVTIRLSQTVELKPEQEPYYQAALFAMMGEKHWLGDDHWIFYSHSYNQHFEMRVVDAQHD